MDTAHEPNPYGYAGEGTIPDPSPDDLEDTEESITVPADEMTQAMADSSCDVDDEQ
ncbi:hypothetical protein [Phytohabitans kaempferiae]|uniref:DUF5709 domain-containing protein n=1 Tax=Phytohabitans kaempferiae TaxID=1620943 RepID=A0ABV6M374_9ACTN